MKKGFTLIELLAVIVILAIIALIATPIILGIINNAKNESDKRSVDLYVKAAELAVARKNLTDEFKPTECKVKYGVCKCKVNDKDITLNVEMDNASNLSGKIIFNEKGVVISNTLSTEPPEPLKIYENGEVVYFDVINGEKCNNYHDSNSYYGYKGVSGWRDTQNSCLKFYAFNDNEDSEIVNLLLDHNTSSSFWAGGNNPYSNLEGPIDILTHLATDTSSWSDKIEVPKNYTLNQSNQESGDSYSIEYSTRARLITAQEIAEIIGKSDWNEISSIDEYYFDTKTSEQLSNCSYRNISGCSYGWLYDRTSTSCTDYGCLNTCTQTGDDNYWTATSYAGSNGKAWMIWYSGKIGAWNLSSGIGVRPVIEVSKDLLK